MQTQNVRFSRKLAIFVRKNRHTPAENELQGHIKVVGRSAKHSPTRGYERITVEGCYLKSHKRIAKFEFFYRRQVSAYKVSAQGKPWAYVKTLDLDREN